MAELARYLRIPAAAALSLLLLGQAAAYYLLPKSEQSFATRPLADFPLSAGSWNTVEVAEIEDAVLRVLRADDTLSRMYTSPSSPVPAGLFVAFFKSQKTGAAPHSPKNCLPGSGWAPLSAGKTAIPIPGRAEPITVNRFVVARGTERTLVLYWYQTPRRVVASEYLAKIWLVLDSLRYRRSDTSMVRIVVPIPEGGEAEAEKAADDFVRSVFPELTAYLPG